LIVDLVRTTTSDGHRLDGAFLAPAAGAVKTSNLDACLFLHGVGSNFYANNLFDYLASQLCQQGLAVLRVNTRGHDTISISWGSTGPVRQGAAYETVDHCRQDISAWVQFLNNRGFTKLGLLGHSLGAIKAIYSQAFAAEICIQAIIACSAPRLSYSAFMNSEAQPRFFESLATAKEHVEHGRPEALFQAAFPFPLLITAGGYLDKYGVEERYNILKFVDRLTRPLLVTYGQLELERGGIAFAGMPEAVLSRKRPDQAIEAATIPGADHIYSGAYEQLAVAVVAWLSRM
jgi:alpha/beta superfamily hydrolase